MEECILMSIFLIISLILVILGIIFLIGFIKIENDVCGILALICFITVLVINLLIKDFYVYNVTITAQNGEKYVYENCSIDVASKGNKVTVMFKEQEPIIFYNPIKIEQERIKKDVD